ncbi:hypothetical protein [Pseudomonas sp. BC115LW]|uniref:hypothetical protein n=1 Tax=Pseudomonas sp. BC115LW TaxID=2683267 RepID=UPI00141200D7|nr:hypothetical protein [Pseudomonas sp. BC115LW]NBB32598.1 hypothetical protein [Pseudomonas sp. BC115LW]
MKTTDTLKEINPISTFIETMNKLRAHHKSLLASGKPQATRSFSTPSPTALDDISPEEAIALEELKSTTKMLAITQNQSVELSITNDAKT